MSSALDQLRAVTTVVADTGDIDAIRALKPADCTTPLDHSEGAAKPGL